MGGEMKGLCQADRILFELFSNDIADISLLTKEDEYKLVKQAQSGNKDALQCLIKSNLKFVLKKAYKFWKPWLSLMDLISEGCIGLIIAVKTYDPDFGFRFLTYAEKPISQRIICFIKLHQKHEHYSLDEPIFNDDKEGDTQKDLLLSNERPVEEKVFHSDIREFLSELNEREKRVIILRYWHDLTLEETGLKIGIGKESVRRNENRALRKMRWAIYNERDALDLENNYIVS